MMRGALETWIPVFAMAAVAGVFQIYRVNAYQTVSEVTPIGVESGINIKTLDLTLQCGLGDFQVTYNFQIEGENGAADSDISFQCSPIVYPWTAYHGGYIALSGKMIRSEVYPVRDVTPFQNLNTTRPASPYLDGADQPTGRKLLTDVTAPDGSWATYPDTEFVEASCINALAHGQNPAMYTLCSPGITLTDYNSLKDAGGQEALALASYTNRIFEVQGNDTFIRNSFLKEGALIQDWQNQTINEVIALGNYTDTIHAKTLALSGALTGAVKEQSTSLIAIASTTDATILLLNNSITNTSTQERVFLKQQALFFSSFATQLSAYATLLADDYATDNAINRVLEQAILDIMTMFGRFKRGDDMRRSQNLQLQAAMSQIAGQEDEYGIVLQPFVYDRGTAPSTDPTSLGVVNNHVTISDSVIRGIYLSSNTPFGFSIRTKYQCSSLFMVHGSPNGPLVDDILEWTGPRGCTAQWTASPFCKCSLVFEEARCPLRNTGGVVDSDALDQWHNTAIVTDTTAGCLTTAVPFTQGIGGLDGTTITSFGDYGDRFATIAQRGLYPGEQYHLTSLTRRVASVAPYSDILRNASNFMIAARPPNETVSRNLVFWWTQDIVFAYQVTYDNLEPYRSAIDGDLPNDIYQKELLWKRVHNGEVLTRGTLFAIMCYSQELLVVSKLLPAAGVATVQYTIDGVSAATSDVIITDNDIGLFRDHNAIAFDPTRFNGVIYDIPDTEFSFSRIGQERGYKVTYDLSPTAAQHARDYWVVNNGGDSFNDNLAGNVAIAYQTSVDSDPNSPTFGMCIGNSRVGTGPLCAIRDKYTAQAFGSFGTPGVAGTILYTARVATYTFRLSVGRGAIRQMQEIGCPVVGKLDTVGGGLILPLTNRGTRTITFRVEQFGQCPKVYQDLSIASGKTIGLPANACPSASAAQPDYIQVSYFLQGEFRPCSASVNLTIASSAGTDPNDVSRVPIYNYTVQLTLYSVDLLTAGLLDIQTRLLNNTAATMSLGAQSRAIIPFSIPNTTFAGYQDDYNAISGLIITSMNQTANAANLVTNLSSVALQFSAEIAQLEQQENAAEAAANSTTQNLVSVNAGIKLTLVGYATLVATTKSAGDVLVNKTGDFFGAINVLIAADILDGTDRWDKNNFADSGNGWNEMANGFLTLGTYGVAAIDFMVKGVGALVNGATSWLQHLLQSGSLGPILAIIVVVCIVVFLGPLLLRAIQATIKKGNEKLKPGQNATIQAMYLHFRT